MDYEVWVRQSNHRCVISGSSHTARGRFSVYSPDEGISFTVGRYDVVRFGPGSKEWVDGFLSGQEPGKGGYANDPIDMEDMRSDGHFRNSGIEVRENEEGIATVVVDLSETVERGVETFARTSAQVIFCALRGGARDLERVCWRDGGGVYFDAQTGVRDAERFICAEYATPFALSREGFGIADNRSETFSDSRGTCRVKMHAGSDEATIWITRYDGMIDIDDWMEEASRSIHSVSDQVRVVAGGSAEFFRRRDHTYLTPAGVYIELAPLCSIPKSILDALKDAGVEFRNIGSDIRANERLVYFSREMWILGWDERVREVLSGQGWEIVEDMDFDPLEPESEEGIP